jgi:polysaccharide deacetylase family protein (PEP-CTERM system associated)
MSFVYTVDVEDWYQVENLRAAFPRDVWLQCEDRVEEAMRRLLDLCEQKEVKGTFFVLGWIARRHPQIVKAIAASGHEVACHGFHHDMLTALDEAAIRRDIAAAKALLEDTAGVRVTGYRAPNFSITDSALGILADLGFEYDSSLFPFARHDRYGKLDTSRFEELAANIYRHKDHGLLEFVLPLRRIGGMAVPWAGGGYFRLFPGRLYRDGVGAVLERNETFIFYMHPWEIDPGQPRIRAIGAAARFRHYVGLASAYRKLDRLLGRFGGTTRLADLAARVRRPCSAASRRASSH